jgi:hypothetical protein
MGGQGAGGIGRGACAQSCVNMRYNNLCCHKYITVPLIGFWGPLGGDIPTRL